MKHPSWSNDARGDLLPNPDTSDRIDMGVRTNSQQDYVQRRMRIWQGTESGDSDHEHIQMGAIARLPLPLQVAFRRKMLIIFEIQLLFVWIVVGIFRFASQPKQWADKAFHGIGSVVASFGIAVVLLVLLYFVRNHFPFNWGLLVLFSIAQSACGVGLGVAVDTNMGFFNCAFTFCCVLIMLLLAGVYRQPAISLQENTSVSDDTSHISVTIDSNQVLPVETDNQDASLLSTFYAGMISYGIVLILSTVLYFAIHVRFGDKFMTQEAFVITLVFQFALLVWFSWDASSMYRVMSPDEYMHGVIYLYTDLILLVILTAVAVGTVMFFAALCSSGGGECSGCYCGGCSGGCNCSSPDEQEEEVFDAQMDRV